jgi:hypothetical protein
MRHVIKGALVALALAGTPLVVSAPAAAATDFSITLGNAAFGYSDGYWDRDHRFHAWRNRVFPKPLWRALCGRTARQRSQGSRQRMAQRALVGKPRRPRSSLRQLHVFTSPERFRACFFECSKQRREAFEHASLGIQLVLVQIVPDIIGFEAIVRQPPDEMVQVEGL